MNYDLTSFEKGLEQLSITLSGEQKQQFLTYYEYLVEKNKVMNLTAITQYEEVITKHFLDSLAVVKTSCFKPEKLVGKRLIDSRFSRNPAEDCFPRAGDPFAGFTE